MATPIMLVAGFASVLYHLSPGQITFLTKNPDGSALDVSSGYTMPSCLLQLQSGPNAEYATNIDLGPSTSVAFSTTGVTISWDDAQSDEISNQLQGTNYNVVVRLSNDGGVTNSIAAIGTLTVDQVSPFT